MTITVTGNTTITTAQLIKPGGPIICLNAGTVITLPIDVHETTGAPGSVTIKNKSGGDQTIVYRDMDSREGITITLPKKRQVTLRITTTNDETRYSPGKPRLFVLDPGEEEIDPSFAEDAISRLGSGDNLRRSTAGTPLADVLIAPTGRPIFFGDSALGQAEYEPGDEDEDNDFGVVAVSGIRLRADEGIVLPFAVVEVPPVSPFALTFSFEGIGLGPMVLFRAVGGLLPPPAVAVSVMLPDPTTLLYGQEVYLTRPDELTSLTVTIDGGASFGGGVNIALDTATVTVGFVGRFWTDGTVWYVFSGATLA